MIYFLIAIGGLALVMLGLALKRHFSKKKEPSISSDLTSVSSIQTDDTNLSVGTKDETDMDDRCNDDSCCYRNQGPYWH